MATSKILRDFDCSIISVGALVTEELVALPQSPDRRADAILEKLQSELDSSSISLVTDVDYLFEPELALDPLVFFKNQSRSRTIIIEWPGNFHDGVLTYATIGHYHYKTWTQPDLCEYCIQKL